MNLFGRPKHRRKTIAAAAFLCLAAGLLAASSYSASMRHSAGRERTNLEGVRRGLQASADRLKTVRRQAERDKQMILDVLGQCRSAEDIPDLRGDRVVARRQGFEKLFIYVPEGSHTLAISSSGKPVAGSNQSKAAVESDTAKGIGNRLAV